MEFGRFPFLVLRFLPLPITLRPGDSPHDVWILTLGANVPDTVGESTECTVLFVNGCQGVGQPVENAVTYLGNTEEPGVRAMIDRLACSDGGTLSPEDMVDGCLDLLGPMSVSDATRAALIEHAAREGDVSLRDRKPSDASEQRVAEVLRLIASTREYQLA